MSELQTLVPGFRQLIKGVLQSLNNTEIIKDDLKWKAFVTACRYMKENASKFSLLLSGAPEAIECEVSTKKLLCLILYLMNAKRNGQQVEVVKELGNDLVIFQKAVSTLFLFIQRIDNENIALSPLITPEPPSIDIENNEVVKECNQISEAKSLPLAPRNNNVLSIPDPNTELKDNTQVESPRKCTRTQRVKSTNENPSKFIDVRSPEFRVNRKYFKVRTQTRSQHPRSTSENLLVTSSGCSTVTFASEPVPQQTSCSTVDKENTLEQNTDSKHSTRHRRAVTVNRPRSEMATRNNTSNISKKQREVGDEVNYSNGTEPVTPIPGPDNDSVEAWRSKQMSKSLNSLPRFPLQRSQRYKNIVLPSFSVNQIQTVTDSLITLQSLLSQKELPPLPALPASALNCSSPLPTGPTNVLVEVNRRGSLDDINQSTRRLV